MLLCYMRFMSIWTKVCTLVFRTWTSWFNQGQVFFATLGFVKRESSKEQPLLRCNVEEIVPLPPFLFFLKWLCSCKGARVEGWSIMEMLGFLFVVAKVVIIYLKLDFLIVFVHKITKVQTFTLVFQSLLCKHILLTLSHLCKNLQKFKLWCFGSLITFVQTINAFWFTNYVCA